jgi:exosortase
MSTGTIPPLSAWKRWIPTPPVMAAWAVLLLGFFWTYRETMVHVVGVWCRTPDYGHGFFVPIFSAFLLWQRQEMVDPWPVRGSWWGLPFLAVFALVRWFNLYLNYERDIDSLLPFLVGMTLVLGGWRALRWAWPSIVFLIFMVPLPDAVATLSREKLQHWSTVMSTYALQTLGIPAIESGNVIRLSAPENQLEVERSCSGLRMLTMFIAICVGTSFVLRAPVWKKIVVLVSSVPIAIISNVMRIVVTGMLFEWVSKDVGNFIHDWAGWWMMILAMLMIWAEMSLLSALLIEPPTGGPLAFGERGGPSRRQNPLAGAGLGPRPDKPRV